MICKILQIFRKSMNNQKIFESNRSFKSILVLHTPRYVKKSSKFISSERKMNFPFSAQFKPANQGGCILETHDSHEFKKSPPAQEKKLVMTFGRTYL